MTVMGMAASQARFLGLTARKSNVEYQVQQINQQRTSLANESAGLYNQMMELSVPTPPSTNSFYKTNYVLDNSGDGYNQEDYKIIEMNKTYAAEGQYTVTLSTTENEIASRPETYRYSNKVVGNKQTNGLTTSTITLIKTETGSVDRLSYVVDEEGNMPSQYNDKGELSMNAGQIYAIDPTKDSALQPAGYKECRAELGLLDDDTSQVYFYQDTNGKCHYMTEQHFKSIINNNADSETDDTFTFASTYNKTYEKRTDVKAYLETAENGRMTAIQIENNEGYPESIKGKSFSLSAKQEFDEVEYNQAFSDYEYEKDLYEKAIQDINAKTETIQAKDQSLELKIKQLDTEQKAVDTEMASVQKIVEENVDKTFNIFG